MDAFAVLFPNIIEATPINNGNLPFKLSKSATNKEILSVVNTLDTAMEKARSIEYNKNPKKIRVFDFDDTLARTNSNILYTLPDGKSGKITPAIFAAEAGRMESEGAVWDFSEFSQVIDGQEGPLLSVAKIIADKRGVKDLFVLTARPQDAAGPIQEFLASMGLNIPIENITGLSDGNPSAKANWMVSKVAEGYNDFYFTDDHTGNVKAVKEKLKGLNVKAKVQLAKSKFSMSTKQELDWINEDGENKSIFTVNGKEFQIDMQPTGMMDFPGKVYKNLDAIFEKNSLDADLFAYNYEDSMHVEFADVVEGTGITNKGDAFKVLSVSANGIIDFVNNKKVELDEGEGHVQSIIFTAKEASRIKLYNSMSIVMANKLGWNVDFKDGTYLLWNPKSEAATENIHSPEVKEVLRTFDVKGPVQKAKVKFSKSLDQEFNDMIFRTKGVASEKEFSSVVAKRRGAKKGNWKYWMPSSLDDFKGLTSYTFAGKGKQGDADQKFFQEALITPYFRGIAAIETMRQTLKNDFKTLNKKFKPVLKKLGKLIPSKDYTYDQAIRVALWSRAGMEVPGLSKRDEAKLVAIVNNDPELSAYADGLLLVAKQENWSEPATFWDAQTILSDLNNMTEKSGRRKYIQEFIENSEIIFSEKNLNKIEAVYGTKQREAIKDILYRMINGTNRPSGMNKNANQWTNWVNNSIGSIMFFNRRSATLQLLSTVNFVNWSDNNPAKAALAFANQPQYWKDFATIFNSDKLRQRRSGLKSDVSEAEIANAVTNSKDKASAALSYLLKLGFTPTQIADSFAISAGGATFYRNRINSLKKKGFSQADAEKQAWEDFSEISEETQQSGDPALISSDQASSAGRLILSFMNTPIQLNRSIKKASLDIYNRRRRPGQTQAQSDISNVSKIIYYGAIQNIIFSTLQNALFALIPGFDDDEETEEIIAASAEEKMYRVLHGMIDTTLKGGFGYPGAVVSTVKNVIREYNKQEEKGFTSDHAYTLLQVANLSPPIGSKLRKVYQAIQTKKFDKDVIKDRNFDVMLDGKFNLSPSYAALGAVTEGATSIPVSRVVDELNALTEALDTRNTVWQRIALGMGWKTWDVSAENEEHDLIKVEAKKERKAAGKIKAAKTRAEKKRKEKERWEGLSAQEQMDEYAIKKAKKLAARRLKAKNKNK
jgi:hypothetical protein